MSQPCGAYRDLLNCPSRQTVQYLVAPHFTCPQCNGGFGDGETLQMIQGPWGCNQLLRNQFGGNYAVGMEWNGGSPIPHLWNGGAMHLNDCTGADMRLTGPYSNPAMMCGAPVMAYGSPIANQGLIRHDYHDWNGGAGRCLHNGGYKHGGRRRRGHSHDYKYKYRNSTRDGQGCTVM